jgi:hypothetical protein
VYWLPEILERWPEARFAVVSREDTEALEATVRAAPMAEGIIRQGWNGYLLAFKGACDSLRARGSARFWNAEALAQDDVVADIMEWLAGERPSARWVERMQRLKVTSVIDPGACVARPKAVAPAGGVSLANFEVTGLSAAMYRQTDFSMVAEWWRAHTGELLAEASLPPLGVVVSDAAGPCAAVWCYESYGVPVAELVFPVTRPGLSLREAGAALAYGLAAAMHSAGKAHEPPADFRFFKIFAQVPMVRFLKRLGFREALHERKAMTLTLPCHLPL